MSGARLRGRWSKGGWLRQRCRVKPASVSWQSYRSHPVKHPRNPGLCMRAYTHTNWVYSLYMQFWGGQVGNFIFGLRQITARVTNIKMTVNSKQSNHSRFDGFSLGHQVASASFLGEGQGGNIMHVANTDTRCILLQTTWHQTCKPHVASIPHQTSIPVYQYKYKQS